MATSITGLDSSANLETQLFMVLEQFSDLQKAYEAANPTLTPKQIVTAYTRDHLTGVVTGSFTLQSTTTQGNDGTVTVVPTPESI